MNRAPGAARRTLSVSEAGGLATPHVGDEKPVPTGGVSRATVCVARVASGLPVDVGTNPRSRRGAPRRHQRPGTSAQEAASHRHESKSRPARGRGDAGGWCVRHLGAPEQVGSGGFGSYAGVLGCAELVAWGTVTASGPVAEGLEVTLEVDGWVHPGSGGDIVTFLADDPARQVGAPSWPPSEERVLVIVSDTALAERLGSLEGERAVRQWRGDGSRRLPEEQCQMS